MSSQARSILLILFFPALAFGDRYADAVRHDKPVAYFSFDKSFGDDGRKLKIRNSGAKTVTRPSVISGGGNRTAQFSGKSYFQATAKPDVFELTGDLSIEFWVRPTKGGERTQCFISKGIFTQTNVRYYVVYFQNPDGKSGRLRFGFGRGGKIDQNGALPENQFSHVVVTYSASAKKDNARIYINGKLNSSRQISSHTYATKGQPLTVGALHYQPPKLTYIQHFVGELDDIAFYNHALSAQDVARHWAATRPQLVFEKDIRPIFKRACFGCHADKPDAKLDVRSVSAMLRGGANGTAIVPGSASQSLLMERIHFGEMPPADADVQLSQREKQLIQIWLDSGARTSEKISSASRITHPLKAQDHWAFRQFKSADPPITKSRSILQTPIDSFIQARLEARGLTMSPKADRMRLARRLHMDLIGLPPTPQQLAAFQRDRRPGALQRLIDRLLSSPHFGIRWGRHWLDVVGYTDTISFDDDYGPPIGFVNGKWRYRDYVIEAFNHDKPYARFLTEQLAGDELVNWRDAKVYTKSIRDSLVATGFLRCCEDITLEDPRKFVIWSVLHDTVEQIGTSLLGLTLNCSRCHTHKFEPIPQSEYYSLMALFTPALNPSSWKNPKQRAVPDVAKPTIAAMNKHNAALAKEVKRLEGQIAKIRQPAMVKLIESRLQKSKIAAQEKAALLAALKVDANRRSAAQNAVIAKFPKLTKISNDQINKKLAKMDRATIAKLNKAVAEQNSRRRKHDWIQAVYDTGPPPSTRLFRRGTYKNPRREVAPGFLSVLTQGNTGQLLQESRPKAGSGRRLALSRWMTESSSPASALTARVLVNRVWRHLLGEPIVATVDNLGTSGARPSHPKLLEWLAADFRRNGSVKRLVKQIVSSHVYQQASFGAASSMARARQVDPTNRLLWRACLRRVEAEVIRDSILSVSGQLESFMGGKPVPLAYKPDGTILVAKQGLARPSDRYRRTVYLMNRRIYNPSFLSVFDKPIVTRSVCKRDKSAVALQSLSMMNDTFVVQQSNRLARRVFAAVKQGEDGRIKWLYHLVIARSPSPAELRLCRQMLAAQRDLHAWKTDNKNVELLAFADLCHTILNLNEFLYLE